MPQYAVTKDRRIAFDVIDAVPPWSRCETVIFHHGIAANRHLWHDWMPSLIDRYRIVGFDMYGCGDSSGGDDPEDWAAAARVDDLFAVADAAGAERFHVVGESYGGTIALMSALRAPGRVATVTVCNAAHIGSSIESVALWESMLDEVGVKGWSDHMMQQRFFPGALSPQQETWYAMQQSGHTKTSIVNILRALLAIDMTNELGKLKMPALLLHADSSPFVPVAVMADLHRRLPESEMQVFAHARHGLPFSHARPCANALRAFLRRSSSRE